MQPAMYDLACLDADQRGRGPLQSGGGEAFHGIRCGRAWHRWEASEWAGVGVSWS